MGAVIHPSPDPASDFEAVYRRCFPFVWRSVLRLGLPATELDDAVQEIFVTAYRRRHDFDGRGSVEAWLFGIARHTVLNLRRRKARRARLWTTFAPRDAGYEDGERTAQLQAAGRHLAAFLRSLDDAKRDAFILGELEQMTGREIARALDINPNTAAARLRAARKAFTSYCERLDVQALPLDDDETRTEASSQDRHWSLLLAACPALMRETGIGSVTVSTGATGAATATTATTATSAALSQGGLVLGLKSFAATVAVGGGVTVLAGAITTTPMPSEAAARIEVANCEDCAETSAPSHVNAPDTRLAAVTPIPDPMPDPIEAPTPAASDEIVEPEPEPEPAARPREAIRRAKTKPQVQATDELAAEAGLIAELRARGRIGDHQAVLKLADEHASRFGEGQLGVVRRRQLLDSLCALGMQAKAAKVLAELGSHASAPAGCLPSED